MLTEPFCSDQYSVLNTDLHCSNYFQNAVDDFICIPKMKYLVKTQAGYADWMTRARNISRHIQPALECH